jgi:hypothetical protein
VPGTHVGGVTAGDTNKARYGDDYYRRIGKLGGLKSKGGQFTADYVGPDGATGREIASRLGSVGGKASRRGKDDQARA